jgi:cell division protein FtsL
MAKPRARKTEFRTVKRIDNSRLVRVLEPSRLRELARWAGLGTLCLCVALSYVWQHFRCIQLGYELEDLKAQQAQALTLNSELRLEIAGLRNPGRIDQIARIQLGLTEPVPGQVEFVNGPGGAEVAAYRTPRTPALLGQPRLPDGQAGGMQ